MPKLRKGKTLKGKEKSYQSTPPEEKFWLVRTILAERETEYLVDWEDDRDTGEQFTPTWEPKSYVSAAAVEDWKQQQAKRDGADQRRISLSTTKQQRKEPHPKRAKPSRSATPAEPPIPNTLFRRLVVPDRVDDGEDGSEKDQERELLSLDGVEIATIVDTAQYIRFSQALSSPNQSQAHRWTPRALISEIPDSQETPESDRFLSNQLCPPQETEVLPDAEGLLDATRCVDSGVDEESPYQQEAQIIPQLPVTEEYFFETQHTIGSNIREDDPAQEPLPINAVLDSQQSALPEVSTNPQHSPSAAAQNLPGPSSITTSAQDTSSLRQPPSSSIVFDSSHPPLRLSSEEVMSDASHEIEDSSAGLSIRERLSSLYAKSSAERARREESILSARSTDIPAEPVVAGPVTQVSATPIEDSHFVSQTSDMSLHDGLSAQMAISIDGLGLPRLGVSEYIVALPMWARVRDQYMQVIFDSHKDIKEFLRGDIDDILIGKMEGVIDKVTKIAIHPDLNFEDSLTQNPIMDDEEAKWAEDCSAKFLFVKYFMEAVRDDPLQINILAENRQVLRILEILLKSIRIRYERPDNRRLFIDSTLSRAIVTLQEAGEPGEAYVPVNTDLVIAFDRNFNANLEHVRVMRRHGVRPGELAPVVHLMIENSVEHVDICTPTTLDPIQRLRAVLGCVVLTRKHAGVLPPEYPEPAASATLLASWIKEGADAQHWPLPSIGTIRDLPFFLDTPMSDLPQSSHSSEPTLAAVADVQTAQKRPLIDENDMLAPQKKQKPAESPSFRPATLGGSEVPRSSVSIVYQTQEVNPASALHYAEALKNMKMTEELQLLAHSQKITIQEQTVEVQKLKTRYDEQVAAYAELQTEYEDRDRELRTLRAEREKAIAEMNQHKARRDQVLSENGKLKEERAINQSKIKQLEADLVNSSIPDVAAFAKLRVERDQAVAEKERLEQSMKSREGELDFIRTQYQEASRAAGEANSELHTLRRNIIDLEQKANSEAAKLRQLSFSNEQKRHLERIQELEQMLEEKNDHIRRTHEASKLLARGRGSATRATSVPKSPKPYSRGASPNSPVGPPNAVMGGASGYNGAYGAGVMSFGSLARGGHPLRQSEYPFSSDS